MRWQRQAGRGAHSMHATAVQRLALPRMRRRHTEIFTYFDKETYHE